MPCTVTGNLTLLDGGPAAQREVTFRPIFERARPISGNVALPEPVTVNSDAAGAVSIDLEPGGYHITVVSSLQTTFISYIVVQEDTPAADLAELVAVNLPLPPDLQGNGDLVAELRTKHQTVVDLAGDVDAYSAALTAFNANLAALQAVADSIADVQAAAAIRSAIEAVAAIVADIQTLAPRAADIGTVADDSPAIQALAAITAQINAINDNLASLIAAGDNAVDLIAAYDALNIPTGSKVRGHLDGFADLASLTYDDVTVGDRISYGDGHTAIVLDAAADEPGMLDYTGEGGVKLRVLPGADGRIHWPAFGPTFDDVTDNGPLLLRAAMRAANAELVMTGRFAIRTPVTIPVAVNLTGIDCTIVDPDDLSAVITFEADRSEIHGISFEGPENYADLDADRLTAASDRRSFVEFSSVKGARYSKISGNKKRNLVYLNGCTDTKGEDTDLNGVLPDVVLSGPSQAGANFMPAVWINGGSDHEVIRPQADHHGSVVLWGSDAVNVRVVKPKGVHLWDNGVYGSSGVDCAVREGRELRDIIGTGVKMRGSRNTISKCRTLRCGTGYVLTGNGVTPDEVGSNGHGNILTECVDDSSYSYPWQITDQDGYDQRDITITGNLSINGSTRGGGFSAPIKVVRGLIYSGNTFVGHKGTSFATILTGASGAPLVGGTVEGNKFFGGAAECMRLQFVEGLSVKGNFGSGNADDLIECRNVSKSVFQENNCTDQDVLHLVSGQSNVGNIVGQNIGNVIMSETERSENLVSPGAGGSHLISSVAAAPKYIGQEAYAGGVFYKAVGTGSPSDWVRLS